MTFRFMIGSLIAFDLAAGVSTVSAAELSGQQPAADVAAEVDRLVLEELKNNDVEAAGLSNDEDFLRRVSLDITGTLPTPRDVTLFGLDPDSDKRAKLIDRLLHSDAYAESWARYWRDVIFLRATNQRGALLANNSFLDWMTERLDKNDGWNEIATGMLTATGNVQENGATALIYAQEADAENFAGEVSRIFLGIQVQCANCHDHPWDRWKRDQFHELAAFFPRIALRPIIENGQQRGFEVASVDRDVDIAGRFASLKENADRLFRVSDRNRDGKLTREEVGQSQLARGFDLLLQRGDNDKDGMLSLTELKEMPVPVMNQAGRGSTEHFMADLSDPASRGTRIDPKFFVTGYTPDTGLDDLERRELFSKYLTSSNDEWFSRAFVNRIWAELTGDGFYMPIDDLGPDRTAIYPEVLDLLAKQFTEHRYDIRWLIQTVTLTDVYQRQVRTPDPSAPVVPFASATPTRLRGDQLYSSVITVLGVPENIRNEGGRGMMMAAGPNRGRVTPRDQFGQLFGFDPSTPQADITGTVPQALYLMNSPNLSAQINAAGFTRLAALLRKFPDNNDAVSELYLLVLSREPSDHERKVFDQHLETSASRGEAFEDLMWSLINSSEFMSKR